MIVPLYDEEKNVPVLISSIREALIGEDLIYEVILVDDASKDRTFEAVRRESARDDRIKGLRFTRHYGKTAAITAG
ncbi:MAG: glycosyltransferase, partial [Thermodesulfobacteriota bacterium]|nr:glycosyltransferase [Thermodesulfobacteriota bacterium]